jgi:hypothetical protein
METKINEDGYLVFKKRDRKTNRIFVHVLAAEKALGKPLPPGAVVHHSNENRLDNRNSNLVICPNRAYHLLLHQRMNAKKACGNPNWLKCWICKRYDAPENISVNRSTRVHLKCVRDKRNGQLAPNAGLNY